MPKKEFGPSGKPRFFSLGELAGGGLPGDLWNVAFSIVASLSLFEMGEHSEQEIRDILRDARTFEEYFKGQLKKHNKAAPEQLYDENASMENELRRIDPNSINQFNEKIMKLRECADEEKLDEEKIEKIIFKEIQPLIYGKERE